MDKPVLLVTDDDTDALRRLERDLERKYGDRYRIIGAASAEESLERLRQLEQAGQMVALLLADQQLPGSSGIEFLKQAITICPEAKRVLLVPFTEAEAAISAIREFRIDHFLLKPWRPPEQNLYPPLDDLLADWEARIHPSVEGLRVVGFRFSPESHQTRDFLVRNCVPFKWLDIERDEEARRLVGADVKASSLPLVLFPDGTKLEQPTNAEIAQKIGLQVRPEETFYDLVIVGGGPAGLAAGVYGASEGLHTVMVERHAPGGQAGLSSMIENYLGFPAGLTGSDLARRAVAQAKKFKAEIVTPQVVKGLRLAAGARVVELSDGSELRCQVVLLATGVEWRRLDVPGIERLTGAGVYYGGTLAEAFFCRNEDVYLVGGGNSAAQAAIYFSRYARTVTMLVRGDSLAESVSQYLIDQIEKTPNIEVRLGTTVVEVHGDRHLEEITILKTATGEKENLKTHSLFIFIGALPHTEYLEGVVERDNQGFLLTGPDLTRANGKSYGWSLDRDPFWLESNAPGVFVAGDVRHGSVKRVAAGVGEGATAVQFIHQYLASTER